MSRSRPSSPQQLDLFAGLSGLPTKVAWWSLEPGREGEAFSVGVSISLAHRGPTQAEIASLAEVRRSVPDDARGDADRGVATLLHGDGMFSPISRGDAQHIDAVLKALLATGRLLWRRGPVLALGAARTLKTVRNPETRKLTLAGRPPGTVILKGRTVWCIDPERGLVQPVRLAVAADVPVARELALQPGQSGPPVTSDRNVTADVASEATPTIVERVPCPVLALGRTANPEHGLVQLARLSFDYGEPGIPARTDAYNPRQFVRLAVIGEAASAFARRNEATEAAALATLLEAGLVRANGAALPGLPEQLREFALCFPGVDAAARWQAFRGEVVPRLHIAGWKIEPLVEFAEVEVVEAAPRITLSSNATSEGWLGLGMTIEVGGRRVDFIPILERILDGGGLEAMPVEDGAALVVVEDGLVVPVPVARLARLLSTFEAMLAGGRRDGSGLAVPPDAADALGDVDDFVDLDAAGRAALEAFLTTGRPALAVNPVDPPASFLGELRDYQKRGLGWMQTLREGGLGGILADDMGLGKTAQTLAHLLAEKEAGRLERPALVVVPTSLVPNWLAEAARFAPCLQIQVHHGTDRQRRRGAAFDADVVLTTYGVLARDTEVFAAERWSLTVLDEAQAIKNPAAQATRAVMRLTAGHRLCLSGTPIENNLTELWSQVAFAVPGLLGDHPGFRRLYRIPIERRGDHTRLALLLRRIRPFVLRRTKAEVAPELPPKTEVTVRVDLPEVQRDLYEAIRLSAHADLRAALARVGLGRSRVVMLSALLRLRQVCCDPRLLPANTPGVTGAPSAKLEHLIQMIHELVGEGRRILLFSQFTSMLDLIKPELGRLGLSYVELTGATTDRAAPVRRFQAGEAVVFLISLKAGGRGLNLTAADTVIHYDPWWNPAAEDQASDRAYRIGQDKPVFIYRLVAAGTVEERILDLQRRKAALATAVIGEGVLGGPEDEAEIERLFAPLAAAP